ncbi:hypothetical protein FNH22_00835 [Fulvivirga sp. M361]|uniref:transmembrane 220 family protein n=1 Tax=Fulvivirga sp. M361 TaxID=2594266 RepID=UPI00117B2CDD|nr:transmembrane 220 family protein [Fulvivirga sp. M361]TRX62672.1 hypothetical protein FNH22_00835 [Fulvivirga sp. M361]
MIHKIIQVILFLLFLSFAALQYNDPDPYGWIAIYGSIAIAFLLSALGKYRKEIVAGIMLLVLGAALWHLPGFITYLYSPDKEALFGEMTHDRPYVETTREFLGLMIGGVALLYLLRSGR